MDEGGHVTATQEALATEIGSVREVVSRQLNAFARDGLVALTRGHIAVVSAKQLERLSHPGT